MGRAMADAFPAARAVFDRARHALGFDVGQVCFEGPLERLSSTEMTQPALTATSLACLAAVRQAGMEPDYVVGHSVGEYAALAASGAITDDEALRLVQVRGLATAEAAAEHPGAMAAVIGLADDEVERLCEGIEGVWPANYNCPGQLVVSGTEDGVAQLMAAAQAAGARRAVRLNVSGGFHSPLTASARRRLQPALDAVRFHEPVTPFFSTVTCRFETAREMAPILLDQLTAPVKFTQAVERLAARGAKTFVEVGSGSVLTGLVKRINKGVQAVSVSTPEGVEKLRGMLARA
jgi:[acyl-carrier-protein] S-malonyltransferase